MRGLSTNGPSETKQEILLIKGQDLVLRQHYVQRCVQGCSGEVEKVSLCSASVSRLIFEASDDRLVSVDHH